MSAGCLTLSKSLMKMAEQEQTSPAAEKQGIVVAILGSDNCGRTRVSAGASLRRTLSADMSSKKWLAHHGFSPMKRIASSEEFSVPAAVDSFSTTSEEENDDEEEEGRGEFDIWSSIQQQKRTDNEKPGEFDIWSSIISQKANNNDDTKSVYIHPLVKRSASSLSENSLKICTESLGSETGSDGFSSYECSETSDVEVVDKPEEDIEDEQPRAQQYYSGGEDQHESRPAAKFSYSAAARKLAPRSFPPPLPSLVPGGAGSSNGAATQIRMRTCRDNGRLVVEAVPVPSQKNYFSAQRQDGRLVLRFANSTTSNDGVQNSKAEEVQVDQEEQNREEFEEHFFNFEKISQGEEEDEIDTEDEDDDDDDDGKLKGSIMKRIEIEDAPKVVPTRLINVHRLALMMNKPTGFANRNPAAISSAWPNNNKLKELDTEEDNKLIPIAQSLPSLPRPIGRFIPSAGPAVTEGAAATVTATATAASVASFNVYEYFWRREAKPTAAAPKIHSSKYNKLVVSKNDQTASNLHHELRGSEGGDYLVPMMKGCKEPRRTLFWVPYCIATS